VQDARLLHSGQRAHLCRDPEGPDGVDYDTQERIPRYFLGAGCAAHFLLLKNMTCAGYTAGFLNNGRMTIVMEKEGIRWELCCRDVRVEANGTVVNCIPAKTYISCTSSNPRDMVVAAACIGAVFHWLPGATSNPGVVSPQEIRRMVSVLNPAAPVVQRTHFPHTKKNWFMPTDILDMRISTTPHGTRWKISFFLPENPTQAIYEVAAQAIVPVSSNILFSVFDMMYTESVNEQYGFHNNRDAFIDKWKDNAVYMLAFEYTEEFQEIGRHPLFLWPHNFFGCDSPKFVYLPAIISIEQPHVCEMLWVSKFLRNKGAARAMLNLTDIRQCTLALPDALDFWNTLNIPYINS
jgi:hypothetical protein